MKCVIVLHLKDTELTFLQCLFIKSEILVCLLYFSVLLFISAERLAEEVTAPLTMMPSESAIEVTAHMVKYNHLLVRLAAAVHFDWLPWKFWILLHMIDTGICYVLLNFQYRINSYIYWNILGVPIWSDTTLHWVSVSQKICTVRTMLLSLMFVCRGDECLCHFAGKSRGRWAAKRCLTAVWQSHRLHWSNYCGEVTLVFSKDCVSSSKAGNTLVSCSQALGRPQWSFLEVT